MNIVLVQSAPFWGACQVPKKDQKPPSDAAKKNPTPAQ